MVPIFHWYPGIVKLTCDEGILSKILFGIQLSQNIALIKWFNNIQEGNVSLDLVVDKEVENSRKEGKSQTAYNTANDCNSHAVA